MQGSVLPNLVIIPSSLFICYIIIALFYFKIFSTSLAVYLFI